MGGCGFQGQRLHSAKHNFEGNLVEVCFICTCVFVCIVFMCLDIRVCV